MEESKVYLIVEQKPETKLEVFLNKANTVLLIGSIVVALTPIVYSGVEWVKYKYKIRKGLKNGSIIKIDGQYYEVDQKSND